jgi:hypothetical protein
MFILLSPNISSRQRIPKSSGRGNAEAERFHEADNKRMRKDMLKVLVEDSMSPYSGSCPILQYFVI